jgi:hypothetical protein
MPAPEQFQANRILDHLYGSRLVTRRYSYRHGDHPYSLDVFEEHLEGLILAEVESQPSVDSISLHFQEAPTRAGGGMDRPQARRAKPGWSKKQTGSRRDKIPEKPPPLVLVRDFEVCHSLKLPQFADRDVTEDDFCSGGSLASVSMESLLRHLSAH